MDENYLLRTRKYSPKTDASAVRFITASGEPDCSMKVACSVKCDYFVSNEQANCFVITDEFNKPVGAVFASTNKSKFLGLMPTYLAPAKKEDPILYIKYRLLLKKLASLDDTYDAFFTLTVLPSFRDKGCGRRLLSAIITHLKSNGAHAICTLVDSPSSLAFCERLGLTRIKKINKDYSIYGMPI